MFMYVTATMVQLYPGMCVYTAVVYTLARVDLSIDSALLCEERLRTAQNGCFCVRNGSVTPREEGLAKQTQVKLLGGWSADDVTAEANPVSIKWSRCWTVPHKQNGSLW